MKAKIGEGGIEGIATGLFGLGRANEAVGFGIGGEAIASEGGVGEAAVVVVEIEQKGKVELLSLIHI